MKLKLLYQTFDDSSLLPKADVTISGLGITLTYTQDGNAKVNANGTTPYVKPYEVGDTFTLNGDGYHIISANASDDYVVALKDTPLTVAEVTSAGGTASDYLGDGSIGGMAYHDSSSAYATSAVKSVVDSWAAAKFTDELKEVSEYSARLITFDEVHSFGYGEEPVKPCGDTCGVIVYNATDEVPNWVNNSNYWYWTMSPYNDSSSYMWAIYNDDSLKRAGIDNNYGTIRPVINVYKSAIQNAS